MIDIDDISGKASISVIGYVINGYAILSKISCKIPNMYWYPDNFMKVTMLVIDRVLRPQIIEEVIHSGRASDFTMEITAKVLEDMRRFHRFSPDVKKDPDIDTDTELFIDALVMEVSMFAEQECIPPANSKVTRVYLDGGLLCVDFEVT